jgi:hypothetical protein
LQKLTLSDYLSEYVASGWLENHKKPASVLALGFWNAISKVYPETRHQRCWVHKTANVLNKLPKSVQPKVKEALHANFGAVLSPR